MSHRFFVTTPIDGTRATLVDAEAHHLIHVMRAKVGDQVTLFDGGGAEYDATVTRLGRADVALRIEQKCEVSRESPVRVQLGIALPKGDRQRWFVEKACELGVHRCIPLTTRRGVAQPEAGTLDKLRRAAIEAAKQCGRNRLPEVAAPMSWSEFVASPPPGSAKWLAHPPLRVEQLPLDARQGGREFEVELERPEVATRPFAARERTAKEDGAPQFAASVRGAASDGEVWLAIGPEGGFAVDEVALAIDHGWRLVGLGPRFLRVETAALSLLAAVSSLVEWTE